MSGATLEVEEAARGGLGGLTTADEKRAGELNIDSDTDKGDEVLVGPNGEVYPTKEELTTLRRVHGHTSWVSLHTALSNSCAVEEPSLDSMPAHTTCPLLTRTRSSTLSGRSCGWSERSETVELTLWASFVELCERFAYYGTTVLCEFGISTRYSMLLIPYRYQLRLLLTAHQR
jgi:hypothetical protein